MSKAYAGIGSRSTPEPVLYLMNRIGYRLAREGYVLRSGAADGADHAFEEGCDLGQGDKQIFLPWRKFNDHPSELYIIPAFAYGVASALHPEFAALKDSVRKLHARSVQQVLGQHCDNSVEFVVCWTPNGLPKGGTATAIKLAKSRGIQVVNLGLPGISLTGLIPTF